MRAASQSCSPFNQLPYPFSARWSSCRGVRENCVNSGDLTSIMVERRSGSLLTTLRRLDYKARLLIALRKSPDRPSY
jgi:hypothetical protein